MANKNPLELSQHLIPKEDASQSKLPAAAGDLVIYRRRWIQLSLFSVFSMTSAIQWISFAPIANIVASHYNVTLFLVNSLSLSWMLTFVLFSPFASWLLARFGLRYGVVAGAAVTCVGGLMRWVGAGNFWVLWTGQLLGSLGQLFILPVPPIVSARWFPAHQLSLATAIMVTFNSVGIALGMVVAPVIVTEASEISRWMMIQFILSGAVLVLTFLFFRARPPTPPSRAEASLLEADTSGCMRATVQLMRSPAFMVIFVTFGVIVGTFYATSTVLAQVLANAGYSEIEGGWLGGLLVGVGLLSSLGIGPVVDKWRCYKSAFIVVAFGTFGSLVWLMLAAVPNNIGSVAAACATVGFFTSMIFPLGLESAVEVTFPVSEAASSGALLTVGNALGMLILVGMDVLQNDLVGKYNCAFVFAAALSCVAAIVSVFHSRRYLRMETEAKKDRIVGPADTSSASIVPIGGSLGASTSLGIVPINGGGDH